MLIVDEHTYDRRTLSWRTLGLTLAVTVVIILAVNIFAWEYLKRWPVNRGVTRVWQKWQMIERQEKPVDWLILGDSTCGQGIIPEVIEAETGETALNLCTVANATVVNGVWQLEHYIEKAGPPKRAIFFHAFHVWERSTADLVTMFDQIPLEQDFYKRLSPALDLGLLGDIEVMTRPLKTLYASNISVDHVLRRELYGLLTGADVSHSDAIADLEQVMRRKGFVGNDIANPEKVLAQSRSSAERYQSRDFFITPENRAALEAACILGEEHGFEIYLANSSISRPLYEDERFQTFYRKMIAGLEAIVAPCETMRYVMKVPAQFDPELMDNEDHVVTDRVATELTLDLVGAVRDAAQVSD